MEKPGLWSENAGYPHPRRVIHSYPQRMDPSFHSLPSSQRTSRKTPKKTAKRRSATKRKTRRSGPSCKNPRSRIAAQQHRRNGKSIQCPFNVTTILGHTHLVGLCSSVVLVLRNYARHFHGCKPEPGNVPFLSKLLFYDRKNRKNASSCANRTACMFNHVRLDRKSGVSTRISLNQ